MKHLLALVIFLFVFSSVSAQKIYTRNDSISITQDSVVFKIGNHKGNVFWQQSLDKINWLTFNMEESDSLIVDIEVDAYYRAKIIESNCNPVYSDTIRISTNDTNKIIYSGTYYVGAYPNNKGEIVNFKVKNDTLKCEKINDEFIFQGDIILTEYQVHILAENKGAAISELYNRWPDNNVYYSIPESFVDKIRVTDAIKSWNEKTNLQFIERTSQENYIEFKNDKNLSQSNIGMIGGRQEILIADWGDSGTAIHEIGHAIGLIHEHSRMDRDEYIIIHYDNIIDGKEYNFDKIKNSLNSSYFDFNSIMLYPCFNNFAEDTHKPVITKKDNSFYNAQISYLSAGDIEIIDLLYPPMQPQILTLYPTLITSTGANCGGNVIFDGRPTILERGVCWNKTGFPTISDSRTVEGSGLGNFVSNLSGLQPSTTYFVRAYAKNRLGVIYGNLMDFTTKESFLLATVNTYEASNITNSSAQLIGNVVNDGGSTVTERGVCWSTTENPTINNNKTNDGMGTGSFTSNLTGLIPNTKYYARAYATNQQGTGYGDQKAFSTTSTLPSVSTLFPIKITHNSVQLNGLVTSDGGFPITNRGFFWCQGMRAPTMYDNWFADTGKIGSINGFITGLLPGTLYSYRTFATNSMGTTSGFVLTFVTDAAPNVSIPTFTNPGNHAIFNSSNSSIVTIEWTEIVGVNEYWLKVFPIGQSAFPVFDGSVINSTSKDLVLNTLGNGIYYFQVKARANNGTWGDYSPAREFIADLPPSSPSLVSPANTIVIPRNTLQPFNWEAPSGNLARYYLRIVSGTNLNGDPVFEKELVGTNTQVLCSWPAGTYSWSVRAIKVTPEGYSPTNYETTIGWGSYATIQSFTVTEPMTLPVLTTNLVSSITQTMAISGGHITSDGGSAISSYGVCWSTSPNPTIANFKTINGSGLGNFTSEITELAAYTTYYLRAYAINDLGIAYGNQVSFTTEEGHGTVTDIDGNIYHTVRIGSQIWMVENLKTTKYNDGTSINKFWGVASDAYCWYDFEVGNKSTYGALYNWYAVNTGKLAPTGWHVPTDAEWTTLEMFLDGENLAGGKLKETGTTHWQSPNAGATNETGFSGMGGGTRFPLGQFYGLGSIGTWWSSTEKVTDYAWFRVLYYDKGILSKGNFSRSNGLSVRCIKDNTAILPDLGILAPTTGSIEAGASTQIQVTINKSDGNITKGSYVEAQLFLSKTTTLGYDNIPLWISNNAIPDFPNSDLNSNGTKTVTATITIPENTLAGNYYLIAVVDEWNFHVELNENNNIQSSLIAITNDVPPGAVIDIEGNVYNTIAIGTQVWMVENLKTTKYNDGTSIPNVSDDYEWIDLTTPGYCWYNNNISYKNLYGGLYNWHTVNSGKLAPTGWHVPSDAEWETLINYLGGSDVAGGKLKEAGTAHWNSPNFGATNESHFTALPGGLRSYRDGAFWYGNPLLNWTNGHFWSSTGKTDSESWGFDVDYSHSSIYKDYDDIKTGFSVRCIRD